uniref:(+)-neomenthol dehydrogenase-like isoform X1 n=1 Tax=Erigeron canadensis TaxID=72917 RepID=UPI001CB8FFE1|nr:(+)-neomenthol dehydrogenase-like isoform X1 [Erigeron canadensis]
MRKVVTGANKGIGYEICRQLAIQGVQVILTALNESQGMEAVKKLNLPNVISHQLDIKDPSSVARLANFIETHFRKLDILINNAAEGGVIILDDKQFRDGGGFLQVVDEKAHLIGNIIKQPYELGEECLKTNYYGTKAITEALLPLLRLSKSPRVVNITSIQGDLYWFHNEKLKEELKDIENLTEERLDEIVQWFLRDLKVGMLKENGWPLTTSAYKVSKAALNAYTRLMARKFPNIMVNCVHPGYVVTDMTFQTGFLTAEEGSKGPVMVALLPHGGPSGVYFDETQQIVPFSSTGLKAE